MNEETAAELEMLKNKRFTAAQLDEMARTDPVLLYKIGRAKGDEDLAKTGIERLLKGPDGIVDVYCIAFTVDDEKLAEEALKQIIDKDPARAYDCANIPNDEKRIEKARKVFAKKNPNLAEKVGNLSKDWTLVNYARTEFLILENAKKDAYAKGGKK